MTEPPINPDDVTFMCCFCGDTCDGKLQIVLARYADETDMEPEAQTWFTHFGCFDSAMVEDARVYDEDEVMG